MDILSGEQVKLDVITGHGGFFKVPGAGQRVMAAALNLPVSVMATAGEGGPWGMAILASYMISNKGEPLADYLSKQVFANAKSSLIMPDPADTAGFTAFLERYKAGLAVERTSAEVF